MNGFTEQTFKMWKLNTKL